MSFTNVSDVNLNVLVESNANTKTAVGTNAFTTSVAAKYSYLEGGIWSAWFDVTTSVTGTIPSGATDYKLQVRSSSTYALAVTVNVIVSSSTVESWVVTTKAFDGVQLETFSVDFSEMAIADPATPPTNMEQWFRSSVAAQILNEGLTRTVLGINDSTKPPAWVVCGGKQEGDYVKMEMVVGLANQTGGVGSINTAMGVFNGNSFLSAGFARNAIRQISIDLNSPWNAAAAANFASQGEIVVPGDKLTAYFFKDTKELVVKLNDRFTPRVQTFPHYDNALGLRFGVILGVVGNVVKDFTYNDSIDRIDPIIYKIRNDHPTYPSVTAPYIGDSGNLLNYRGFTPIGGDINGIPIEIVSAVDGLLTFKLLSFNELRGNVFSYVNATTFTGNTLTLYSKFGNAKAMLPLLSVPGGIAPNQLTADGSPYINTTNSVHKAHGGSGLPINTRIYMIPDADNVAINSTTGVVSHTATTQVIKEAWVVFGDTGILRTYRMVLDAGPVLTQFIPLPSPMPTPHSFNNDPSTEVISQTTVASGLGLGGESLWIENGEISFFENGSWGGWLAPTEQSPYAVPEAATVTYRLRTTSSSTPFGKKTVTLHEDAAVIFEEQWHVYNGPVDNIYKPDLAKSSAEQVLELLNFDNSLNLGFDKVGFGVPEVGPQGGEDTRVAVIATASGGFGGSVIIDYERMDLAEFADLATASLTVPATPTLADVVTAFNKRYDTNLSMDDVDPTVQPGAIEEEPIAYTLVANTASLAYIGSIVLELNAL